ncbi:hypothetical protein LINGRAHAP2_LOCUS14718, partial [Linum grandiflorum]
VILLSWNCRGVGRRLTVNHLRKLARTTRPSIIFLMETKQDVPYLEGKRTIFNFANGFTLIPSAVLAALRYGGLTTSKFGLLATLVISSMLRSSVTRIFNVPFFMPLVR